MLRYPDLSCDTRINVGNIEERYLILVKGVIGKGATTTNVVSSIGGGFNLPFCPLAVSRKGHMRREGIEPVSGEALDCG